MNDLASSETSPNFQARQALLKRQCELRERLNALKEDSRRSYSHDWSEQAQERENDEVIDSLALETEQELRRINRVLEQIGSNNYGFCQECGKFIGEQRLRALPDAELCISCAKLH